MSEAAAVMVVLGICALAGAAGGIAAVCVAGLFVQREFQRRLDTLKGEWIPPEAP